MCAPAVCTAGAHFVLAAPFGTDDRAGGLVTRFPGTRQGPATERSVRPAILAPSPGCAAPVGAIRFPAEHRKVRVGALDRPALHVELRSALSGRWDLSLWERSRLRNRLPDFGGRFAVWCVARHRAATHEHRNQPAAQQETKGAQNVSSRRRLMRGGGLGADHIP
jgi:hypothetical protein